MTNHNTLRAIALAGVCLAPLAAVAQSSDVGPAASGNYTNELSVGGRYQSSDSPFFGRYTGYSKEGFTGTVDFSLGHRDAVDSGKTGYYEIIGQDLGYGADKAIGPESSINAKAGFQGSWGVSAGFDSISYVGNTIHSPYYNTGALAPGFRPYGGAPSMNSAAGAFTTISPTGGATAYSAQNFANAMLIETTGTRRDALSAGGKFLKDNWTITSDIRTEHKEGTLEQSVYLGAQQAIALPINYDTTRYDVKAAYQTRALQAQLGYTFSKFSDNNGAFIFQDTVAGGANSQTAAGANPPGAAIAMYQVNGAYSQMPSNSAHYVTGMVGYNVTNTTRVNANFRYGLEMQDDQLPPAGYGSSFAVNPNLALLASNPSSLAGLARVYQGSVQATSRPITNLDLKAGYSVDGRDVATASSTIAGMTHALEGGNFTLGAPDGSGTVAPQNWTKQKATVEGTYRVLQNTKLTLGYTLNEADRGVAQAGRNIENTGSIKLATSVPSIGVNGSVSYAHSDRSASATHVDLPWQAFSGDPAAGFPSMTFYQAARVQDVVKVRGDYMPTEELVFGVNGRLTNNTYTYPTNVVGNSRDYNASVGPDITFSPNKSLTANLFYTYEEVYYGNRGAGAAYDLNGGYGWSASSTDAIHTLGASADWKATDRLKVGFAYTYSSGDLSYMLFDGITSASCLACAVSSAAYANVANPPTIGTTMHSLQVHGTYAVAPNIDLWAGYQYSMFKDNDWAYTAWSAVTQTTATGYTVSSGAAAPASHANVVMTKVRLKF